MPESFKLTTSHCTMHRRTTDVVSHFSAVVVLDPALGLVPDRFRRPRQMCELSPHRKIRMVHSSSSYVAHGSLNQQIPCAFKSLETLLELGAFVAKNVYAYGWLVQEKTSSLIISALQPH